MVTKKTSKVDLKNDHKENLFNDFFYAVKGTMEALELHYGIPGVMDHIFGNDSHVYENEQAAKANLRKNRAWGELSGLYDYAIHGIVDWKLDGPSSIVINGSEVLLLATSEDWKPSHEWLDIVAMGDGRFALDDGEEITIYKLALLAKVDQRTVRNAISSGHLLANKRSTMLGDEQMCVENASARRWLNGRKGFKPTVVPDDGEEMDLSQVDGPAKFGVYLANQRKRLGLDTPDGKLVVRHASVNAQSITDLESGIFALPLDAVFPLADFYQVSRKELLDAVMRVFFVDEWIMLKGSVNEDHDKMGGKK